MLETRHLLTFDAVVRTGTLAAAARELGYTQPGVSQHIRALERELKATLFVRAGRMLRLSEQGEVLAAKTSVLLSDLLATAEHVAAVARLRDGLVKVCAFPSANATLVPAAISKMRSDHLGVQLELFEAEPPDSLAGLKKGDYDIVVTFHYDDQGPIADDDTLSFPLMQEPLVLFMAEDHPLARRQQVGLAELSEERWIAGCLQCRQEFVSACEDAGFSPRIDVTTDDNLAVQSYVVAGLGLAMMPRMIQTFVKHPRLRIRPILPSRNRTITATILRGNRNLPAVKHMLESLTWAAEKAVEVANQ
ncbi:LysR family transcriptional regulator [Arthrobacter sp. CDRTa11]|uniref:LysR family transcriptional regulator n=1 Tax=Arthrobacter sp. CDRTa11 TaxID=2651199 RepID=UPI002265CA43|nr:LysR family transcriptional regulator [Arthrobacter sp. CDRTa11]UZX02846.1 LysR family transcriptional regulator [Arthrobacter sp. CDRTa11]